MLAITLAGLSGCDSHSRDDKKTAPAQLSPTDDAAVSPPRPIPEESLPFAADELNVAAAFPGPGEQRVALVSPISIGFDAPLLPSQDLTHAIRVMYGGNEIPGSISQTADDTLLFRPTDLWMPNRRYTIEIDAALMSAEGRSVNAELQWEFVTIADVHTTSQNIIDLCMSDLDVEMLAAVNQARSSARFCGSVAFPAAGKLSWNCRLQDAAISHSQDMANNDFFEHTGSDGSDVAQRITRAGYAARLAAENLAVGYQTTAAAMEGLLGSFDHCTTLMNPELTEFGFGYAYDPDSFYRHYWTQNFAHPASR
jgi:uncharacterized protein YkwD